MSIKHFKSVDNFIISTEKIANFVQSVGSSIHVTTKLVGWLDHRVQIKSNPKYKEFKPFIEFDKTKKLYIFELGFLSQFANLENFMYEILKELYLKHSSSIKTDNLITYKEILNINNTKEIREYLADKLSIENSYSFDLWSTCLQSKFGIKVFNNKKLKKLALYLNIVRNSMMHGGKKVNSKTAAELKKHFNVDSKLGEKIDFDKNYYKWLFVLSQELAKNINNGKK